MDKVLTVQPRERECPSPPHRKAPLCLASVTPVLRGRCQGLQEEIPHSHWPHTCPHGQFCTKRKRTDCPKQKQQYVTEFMYGNKMHANLRVNDWECAAMKIDGVTEP